MPYTVAENERHDAGLLEADLYRLSIVAPETWPAWALKTLGQRTFRSPWRPAASPIGEPCPAPVKVPTDTTSERRAGASHSKARSWLTARMRLNAGCETPSARTGSPPEIRF